MRIKCLQLFTFCNRFAQIKIAITLDMRLKNKQTKNIERIKIGELTLQGLMFKANYLLSLLLKNILALKAISCLIVIFCSLI